MTDEKNRGGEGQKNEQSQRANSLETQPSVISTSPESIERTVEKQENQSEKKFDEILLQSSSSTVASDSTTDHVLDAKSISEGEDEESKIQKLLDLASTKGVVYAVKVAKSLSDYYVLDRMHDELVDKFYEGLLAKGLITKE